MKRLIFILFVIVFVWLLIQLYAAVVGEEFSGGVIPYFEDIQNNTSEEPRMILTIIPK